MERAELAYQAARGLKIFTSALWGGSELISHRAAWPLTASSSPVSFRSAALGSLALLVLPKASGIFNRLFCPIRQKQISSIFNQTPIDNHRSPLSYRLVTMRCARLIKIAKNSVAFNQLFHEFYDEMCFLHHSITVSFQSLTALTVIRVETLLMYFWSQC